MNTSRLVGARSFAALEREFARDLAAAPGSPGKLTWVLVPTNLLALHLRRVAAREAGGLMGVEFLTIRAAARRMVQFHLTSAGRQPVPDGAEELVLRRIIAALPAPSYFASLRDYANSAPAMHYAIRLLEDCLWTPDRLRSAAESGSLRDPGSRRKLAELADIWDELKSWRRAEGVFTERDLLSRAASEDRPIELPDICCLYGFYDFTPVQRSLVSRLLSTARSASAYLLWWADDDGPTPGFEYAKPVVDWLASCLRVEGPDCIDEDDADSDLARLRRDCFQDRHRASTKGERNAREWDGTVRVVSCPGQDPEAVEIARAALSGANVDAVKTTGVLLRSGGEDAARVAEGLDRTGVRYFIREGVPLTSTVAGRLALKLVALSTSEPERVDVLDFLAVAEMPWPEGLSATTVHRLSREAGVKRGRDTWRERLGDHAAALVRHGDAAETDSEAEACRRDAVSCRLAAKLVDGLLSDCTPSTASTWAESASRLSKLLRRYAPRDEEGTREVLDAVASLGALDMTGTTPDESLLSWVLGRRLAAGSVPRERFQHTGVCVSSIMGVRGATFDRVIVPGLVEKGFPRHISSGTLLTETDREDLNGCAERLGAADLPLQSARPDEERYLFRIALGSARREVVLTYPRLEQHSGRPRFASRFLTAACSALAGHDVTDEDLARGLPTGLVQRVPLSGREWSAEELRCALDELEYDAAVFAPGKDGPLRTDYLARVSAHFERAMQMEAERWGVPTYGPYDGKIRAGDLLEALADRYAQFGEAVSPTRLETYAYCPFQYFLTYVLGVAEVETPPEELELTPLERGSIIHQTLARLFTERFQGSRLGTLTDEEVADGLNRAGEILDELAGAHAENHRATWMAERARTLEELKLLLETERNDHPEACPERFEWSFGYEEWEPYRLEVGDGRTVEFHGFVDRVDRLPDGAVRVLDYKTGSSRPYKRHTLRGGRQLQLPVYLMASCELLEAEDGTAAYLFTREGKEVAGPDLDSLSDGASGFRRAVRLILDQIAAGNFPPLPPEDRHVCDRYCDFRCVCGTARAYLAEMKQADADLAGLRELRGIE